MGKQWLSTAAAFFLFLHRLELILVYATVVHEVRHLPSQNLILYLFSNRKKHLPDIFILLCTHLEVLDPKLVP